MPSLNDNDDDALAAEFVLGLLPRDERVAFEKRLHDDQTLRRSVSVWGETLLPLSSTIEPVSPPTDLYTRIESTLFAVSRASQTENLFSRLWVWRTLSAAGVAASLFLGILLFQTTAVRAPDELIRTALLAQLENEAAALRVAAFVDSQSETLVLTRQSGEAEAGRAFELWLIAGDNAPISLGVLASGPRVEVPLSDDVQRLLADGTALAISDEPLGGSPTGQPTGDILAVGSVTQLNL
ncbi:MAG: anti-sigma factor [Pseudomonadota bacterium]